jgi:hypothetical protein
VIVIYKHLRSWLLATLVLCITVLPACAVHAQTKSLLVVSVSGVDPLLSDVSYLLKSAGFDQYAPMAQMLTNSVAGVDKARPIGVVVTTDGGTFTPLGFIPVSDLKTLLASLPPQAGQQTELGDGVIQLQGAGPVPLFIKEHAGWAFISHTADALENLPDSPSDQLEGLDQQYGVAIRVRISNVPDVYKQLALNALGAGVNAQLTQLPNESDGQFQLRKSLAENQIKQMQTLINEVDQLTIGWNTDPQAKSTYIETTVSAVAGTKTAKQIETMANAKTAFAGFVQSDAALKMNLAGQLTEEDITAALATLESVRQTANQEIQNDADLPNQPARDAAQQLLDGAFDVITKTVQSGTVDGAVAVNLAPSSLTALMAGHVADGNELEALLKKLAELAKDDPKFPGINFNADEHAGVQFHTLNVDLPPDEDVSRVFGDQLNLVVGTGPTSVYFAAGKDGLNQLKTAIDQSASAGDTEVTPFQLKIAVGQIVRFIASVDADPDFASLAKALEETAGADHVLVFIEKSNEGVRYRIELQEGVLRAIGEAAQAAQAAKARAQAGF